MIKSAFSANCYGMKERQKVCGGGVGEGGGCSCHDHFYSVLGVKYLTTTMCYRLKPDA